MSESRLAQLLDPSVAPILFATVSNMEPQQLIGVAERSLRHLVVPSLPFDADEYYDRMVPSSLVIEPDAIRENTTTLRRCLSPGERRRSRELATATTDGNVTFLNQTVTVDGTGGVDWFEETDSGQSPLWLLKFRGFEFLKWAYLGYDDPSACPQVVDVFWKWLQDWDEAEATRIGRTAYLRRAWTPHAVSLRLLNLSRLWAWQRADSEHDALVSRLLVRNVAFLSNHVEHDVGGNHLIENGAALAMAGLLLGDTGSEWRRQGVDVLTAATDQFLDDGGHFELSTMYHVLTLTRYLTVVDLLRRSGLSPPPALCEVATRGTRFLRAITPPDGRLPLLNDAVSGEAIRPSSCLRYAEAVGIDPGPSDVDALAASGYYWLGDGDDRLLVDGGEIGPAHLPGHSHNDQFAVLLWVDGRQVLTDTGTYEYASDWKRQHARSVAAHNTVQYGDVEPIAIGGRYLLGRRFDPPVDYGDTDGVTYFDGIYSRKTAFRRLYTHRRRIYAADDWWLVWDTVDATDPGLVRSRLHVAPGLEVETVCNTDQPRFDVREDRDTGDRTDSEPLAHVVPLDADGATVSTSPYFPKFGRAVTRPKISLESDGESVAFGFLLSTRPYHSVSVEHHERAVTGISLDDHYRTLPTTPLGQTRPE